ncbi:MAG: gamma-glutamylcyclotransferase family protein [Pseudomonadota bacterium]
MHTCLYFAYGSNLLSTRLGARCTSARVVGVAMTDGWTVSFTKPGGDGSGKAGLVQRSGVAHPGVVYELAADEMPLLDRIEGVGHGYTREDDFQVTMVDGGSRVSTATYMPQRHDPALIPFDWYLALCIAGATEHRFDAQVLAAFQATPSKPDIEDHRPARLAGIEALQAAGHDDWQGMF